MYPFSRKTNVLLYLNFISNFARSFLFKGELVGSEKRTGLLGYVSFPPVLVL